MFVIRDETIFDVPGRETLLDACFGNARFAKTCERLREGRVPAEGLARVIEHDGRIVGTVRLWHIDAGRHRPALMLGPIAIEPALQGLGLGAKLMRDALGLARSFGHRAVLLVGDAPYYERFGFTSQAVSGLRLPGPHERERFLGLEFVPGALAGGTGMVSAAGPRVPAGVRTAKPVLVQAA